MILWTIEEKKEDRKWEVLTYSEINKFGGRYGTKEEAETRRDELQALERVREGAPRLLAALTALALKIPGESPLAASPELEEAYGAIDAVTLKAPSNA